MSLRFVHGNLLDYPAEAYVNTINCVGVMGKGIALQFATRYPELLHPYRELCRGGAITPGSLWVRITDDGTTILNVATKDHWRKPSRYAWVEAGLDRLAEIIPQYRSVVIPALGCGNGGLDWERVRFLIQNRLRGLKSEITVVGPR